MGVGEVSWCNYSKILVQSRCCKCAHAWDSTNAPTQSWWPCYSGRCGRHLYLVELKVCENCKWTKFLNDQYETWTYQVGEPCHWT